MKRRLIQFLAILFMFILLGCSKEKYSGKYSLSDELKFILPVEDTYLYYNNDSIGCSMNLSSTDNFYFNDSWDDDDGGYRIIYYTGDFEVYNRRYTADLFNIYYSIHVDKHGELHQDVLDITIDSHTSSEIIAFRVEMPLEYCREMGYETNIEFADSLTFNNLKLFNVYFTESDELMYYLQADKGLVAFEFDKEFWMLSD